MSVRSFQVGRRALDRAQTKGGTVVITTRSNKLLLAGAGLGMCLTIMSGCVVYVPKRHHGPVGVVAPPRVSANLGLTLIAGTAIYFASRLAQDIFYHGGNYYWCDGPYWYVSSRWGGSWRYVHSPPRVFLTIPSGHARYHVVYRHPGHRQYHSYRRTHFNHYSRRAPATRVHNDYQRAPRTTPHRPVRPLTPNKDPRPQPAPPHATPRRPVRPLTPNKGPRVTPGRPVTPPRATPRTPPRPQPPKRHAPKEDEDKDKDKGKGAKGRSRK